MRYRRACACAATPKTVCAAAVPKPVAKGMFTASFLARLIFQKHVLGLPVHRIIAGLSAEGADFASGTLVGQLKAVAPLVRSWAAAIATQGADAAHVRR